MPGLKLKWDASGGKTMHEGALVLVGFLWSLSVLTRLFSLWSDCLSSLAIFSENDEVPYKVYHLMYVTKHSCTCKKRINGRKENKKKQNKINKVRYKKSEKRK